MAQSSTARKIDEAPILTEAKRAAFGGGDPPAPPMRPTRLSETMLGWRW